MTRIGKERGLPPLSRDQYDQLCGPEGALVVGSPQQVIDKILWQHELFGHQRSGQRWADATWPSTLSSPLT